MSHHQKICDLPNNEGSVVVIVDDDSMIPRHVLQCTLTSFKLLHGGSKGLTGPCCGGKLVPIQVSDAKQVLACKRCNFRNEIPNNAIALVHISK